jgi:hypothetical protein
MAPSAVIFFLRIALSFNPNELKDDDAAKNDHEDGLPFTNQWNEPSRENGEA